MSTGLLKVAERAKREPDARFNSLAHLVDEAALGRAFGRIRKEAAVGVDGITKEQYGQQLEGNLQGLHERLRTMRYRHQPIRRVHIPKAGGRAYTECRCTSQRGGRPVTGADPPTAARCRNPDDIHIYSICSIPAIPPYLPEIDKNSDQL